MWGLFSHFGRMRGLPRWHFKDISPSCVNNKVDNDFMNIIEE
jgi:hypothetical protein